MKFAVFALAFLVCVAYVAAEEQCPKVQKDCRTFGSCKGCMDARTNHPSDYGHCGWCESSRMCQNTQWEHCLGGRWSASAGQCTLPSEQAIDRCRTFSSCDACVNAKGTNSSEYGDCSWCAATNHCAPKWQETCDSPWVDHSEYCAVLPQAHNSTPKAGRCGDTSHLQTCESCFTAAVTNPTEYGDCKWCESTQICADSNAYSCINNEWSLFMASCRS